jgi:sterol desaturase/sphingolipid hydroxylase (fatty acid hydroxylase superfamily)
MIVVAGTLSILVGFNLIGLALSIWLDKRGVPASMNAQIAQRKPGSLRKRAPLILFNLALLTALTGPPLFYFSSLFSLELPALSAFLLQFCVLVLFDDAWFYWVHRLIHENKWLYRKVHKKHHEAYAPVPIEYIYVHPAEWMAGSMGPAIAMAAIIGVNGGMSAWTLWLWGAWRVIHELDIHSGIAAKVSHLLPFFAGTEHHDLHHARPTMGNYASSLTVWDKLFGTENNRTKVKR